MSRVYQNIYSPLPQSLSDSDSEKDAELINSSHKNHEMVNDICLHGKQKDFHPKPLKSNLPRVENVTKNLPFLRKLALVLTTLLCFLPILLVLWILPCSEIELCTSKRSHWKNQFANVEFKGKINPIGSVFRNRVNLAVAYKGNQYAFEELNHGVVAFLGNTGEVAWNFRQEFVPKVLDCSLIDVNANGLNDCLLLDERGLKVLGTMSGEIIWHVHSEEEGKTIVDLEFPIVIQDLNNDNINELLLIYKRENLLIVCGKTGRALKSVSTSCVSIMNLKLDHLRNIIFSCSNESEIHLLSIMNLKKTYENVIKPEVSRINKISLHQETFEAPKKVVVKVEGNFPNSTSSVMLQDVVLNHNIYRWKFENTFVTEVINFPLEFSQENLHFSKGSLYFFKSWNWLSSSSKVYRSSNSTMLNGTYFTNKLSERVALIIYKPNNFSIHNLSISEITQLCYTQKDADIVCQPDLDNLKQSLVTCDLNQDGTLELITYSSTFIINENNTVYNKNWKLMSFMTVIDLQQQLRNVLSFI